MTILRFISLSCLISLFCSCSKKVGIEHLPVMEKGAGIFITAEDKNYETDVKCHLEQVITKDRYFRLETTPTKADYSVELNNADYYAFDPENFVRNSLIQSINPAPKYIGYDKESGLMRCSIRNKNGRLCYQKDFTAYTYKALYYDDKATSHERARVRRENEARREKAQNNSTSNVAERIYTLLKKRVDLE